VPAGDGDGNLSGELGFANFGVTAEDADATFARLTESKFPDTGSLTRGATSPGGSMRKQRC
jgi:hypothetical protein